MRDPIVEQVRKARHEYAAQFNHDLDLIVADLQRRQTRGEFKVVSRVPRRPRKMARPCARQVV